MAELSAITAAIETRLATISGLQAHSEAPDQINVPAAWPRLVEVVYDDTLDGGYSLRFEVNLAAAPVQVGYARGQAAVWPYLQPTGAKSLKAALEADGSFRVASSAEITSLAYAGVEYFGAKLMLWVMC